MWYYKNLNMRPRRHGDRATCHLLYRYNIGDQIVMQNALFPGALKQCTRIT